MEYFKIYGLQRTGTNYISSLIEKNFENVKVFMNVGGWKHGNIIRYPNNKIMLQKTDKYTSNKYRNVNLVKLFKENVNFIVTVKNPYTWILSYLNHYRLEKNKENIKEIVKLWNTRYSNYKKFIEKGTSYLIKYEDVLENYLKILKEIMKKFHLKKSEKKFKPIKNKLKANVDSTIGVVKDEVFNKTEYYINPEINKIFNKKEIKTINYFLDKDLVSFYGYEIRYF